MKTETTPALARGIFCHSALEEVFDLSAEDRTLDNLQNLFRREWGRHRRVDPDDSAYSVLFRDDATKKYNLDEEIEWGTASIDLLENYYRLEDPSSVPDPNPLMREMWCHGSTALDDDTTVTVRGKIDRIDVDVSDKIRMSIIDYKTGKKPNFKYSCETNERIANEQFFKMRVYFWMLTKMMENTDGRPTLPGDEEEGQRKFRLPWILSERIEESLGRKVDRWTDEVELTNLRLMFLSSHVGDRAVEEPGAATYLDYPIRRRDEEFAAIDEEIRSLVGDIKRLVDLNDTRAFEHCDWSYCSCHQLRAGFEPSKVHWTEEARELLG
ncbi:hypothetical protein THAOC_26912 [Thalassiosira oceanica]|uniref:PD-(D/E)XK endonuclease-like domain-containing protein n=2 Tax=Thalassiosira oceanica TaxID=159749 RepID=K0RIU5_THAOC|nr:hypothetical protein THAOC_26912 [Thalassiosira oceanica]|eukprot:EJK53618.1 hypothetical protein THAOC_26912 [Thalassiosira oceanica]